MAGSSTVTTIACMGGGGEEEEEEEKGASGSLCLEMLPQALLQSVMARLDVSSLCSAAAACKAFHASASQALSFIPSFHLLEIAPKPEMVRRLLPENPCMRSLKLDCARLGDSSIVHLMKPSLQELCLQNCDMFSSRLLSEVGKNCRDLRSLSLGLLAEGLDSLIHCSDLEQLLRGCSKLEPICDGIKQIMSFIWNQGLLGHLDGSKPIHRSSSLVRTKVRKGGSFNSSSRES